MYKIIVIIIAVFLIQGADNIAHAQSAKEFSCEKTFGAGFTPVPGNPLACCYPGTVPVPGENRCAKPGTFGNNSNGSTNGGNGGEAAPGGHCAQLGKICTIGGAPCCKGTCKGKFPNTYCR